jgi:class 3 adenylate cyclase
MRPLPTGTVTLLFTDIEGSTRLLHELGDGYPDVLAEHRRILRDAFGRHGGVEVDTQGDAFFVELELDDARFARRWPTTEVREQAPGRKRAARKGSSSEGRYADATLSGARSRTGRVAA